jgi:hypothetical protein
MSYTHVRTTIVCEMHQLCLKHNAVIMAVSGFALFAESMML